MILKKKIIASFVCMWLLSGCKHNSTVETDIYNKTESVYFHTTSKDNTNEEEKQVASGEYITDKDNYIPDDFSSDVVLYFGSDMFTALDARSLGEVNNYLKKKGCNYRISLVDLTQSLSFENGTKAYAQALEEYLDNGGILDLCYLTSMYDNSNITSYDILAEDDYLEDLSVYMDIDKLNDYIPQTKLDALMRKGKLYGLNGYVYSTGNHISLGFNKHLVDKYGLSDRIKDKTISELLPILREMQEKEGEVNPDFNAVLFNMPYGSTLFFSNCYQVNPFVMGVCLDEADPNNPVKCIFDQVDFINSLREAYSVVNDKTISSRLNLSLFDFDDCFLMVSFMGTLPGDVNSFVADNYPLDAGVTGEDIIISQPYGKGFRVRDELSASAILKVSKHKELAADFLYRLMTDAELTNIVEYGPNRVIIDGKMYVSDGTQFITPSIYLTWVYANGFISTPTKDEFENKKDKLFSLYDEYGYVSDYKGFRFEGIGYSDEIASSEQVLNSVISNLLSNEVGDFNNYIERMKMQYLEKGGGEILNAVKKQYEAGFEKER